MDTTDTCPLKFLEFLNEMRVKNDFCDAVIKTEDGGCFKVHKIILIASSPYFRALYLNSPTKSEALIPGVSSRMMEYIIEYAYLRRVNVHWHNVWDLIVASDQFSMMGLLTKCQEFFIKHMAPLNCIRIWKFARNFFISDLESKAYSYLLAKTSLIQPDNTDFMNLTVDEMYQIFSDSKLNLSEEHVFWLIMSWLDLNQVTTPSGTVQKLLSCVRTSFVGKDFLFREIINNRLVAFDENCRSQILDKYRFLTQLPLVTDMDMICPPLATPRVPYDILFLIGGCVEDEASNNIQAYDSKADMWMQVYQDDASLRRAYHKCVAIDYEIYVIGGRDEYQCITSCHAFNVIEKSWREIAPMIYPRSSLCTAVLDGEIYAIGGSDGEDVFSSTEIYNPSLDEWRISNSLYSRRVRAGAATLNDTIFVVGGYTGKKYLKSVEVYDAYSREWIRTTSMRHKRSELSVESWNGFLYAAGGYCGNTVLRSVERYDPSEGRWVLLSQMKSPRCQFSMAVIGGHLVIIGGLTDDDTETYKVEQYDQISNEWNHLGDNDYYCLAAAGCVVKDLDDVSEYAIMDRSRVLIEKREQLTTFKERNDGSFIRAISMYNT